MATIFIVLAVIALVSIVRRVDDEFGAGGEPGEKLICRTIGLSADLLFDSGDYKFKSPAEARKVLIKTLGQLAEDLPPLRRYAKAQKEWGDGYFVVLEVSGHTDLDPLGEKEREGADGNWDLAAQRAVWVAYELEDILTKRADLKVTFGIVIGTGQGRDPATPVGSTLVRVAGYASHVPFRTENQKFEETKRWNRRVELRLYAQPVYVVKARDPDS